MRFVFLISFLLCCCFNGTTQAPAPAEVPVKEVFSGMLGRNSINIYKRASLQAPYLVKINQSSDHPRYFYVIKYVRDVFRYLMVEKNGSEIYYYPLVWTELNAVTVEDLTQRSKEILAGKVPRVNKENL